MANPMKIVLTFKNYRAVASQLDLDLEKVPDFSGKSPEHDSMGRFLYQDDGRSLSEFHADLRILKYGLVSVLKNDTKLTFTFILGAQDDEECLRVWNTLIAKTTWSVAGYHNGEMIGFGCCRGAVIGPKRLDFTAPDVLEKDPQKRTVGQKNLDNWMAIQVPIKNLLTL